MRRAALLALLLAAAPGRMADAQGVSQNYRVDCSGYSALFVSYFGGIDDDLGVIRPVAWLLLAYTVVHGQGAVLLLYPAPAPHLPGETINNSAVGGANDAGVTAIAATIAGSGRTALYRVTGTEFDLVAVRGDPMPAAVGGTLDVVGTNLCVTGSGGVFFKARAQNGTTNPTGLFHRASPTAPIELVALTGDPAPGTSGTLDVGLGGTCDASDSGALAFWSSVAGDPAVTQGIFWRAASGGPLVPLRLASGLLAAGETYDVYGAIATDDEFGYTYREYLSARAVVGKIEGGAPCCEREPLPQGSTAPTVGGFVSTSALRDVNEAGVHLIHAGTYDEPGGEVTGSLFAELGSTSFLIARAGLPVPGWYPGLTMQGLGAAGLSSLSTVVFNASVDWGESEYSVLCSATPVGFSPGPLPAPTLPPPVAGLLAVGLAAALCLALARATR